MRDENRTDKIKRNKTRFKVEDKKLIRPALDFGRISKEEFINAVYANLNSLEVAQISDLSVNKVEYRCLKLNIRLKGETTMKERNFIKNGYLFVREKHASFTSWHLASRSGDFVLNPYYMDAMFKWGFLVEDGKVIRPNFDKYERLVCAAR